MRNNFSAIISLLFFAMTFSGKIAFGSHAQGMELTYSCTGGNTYLFTLYFYRDCSGIPAPPNFNMQISSPSCGFYNTITLFQVGPALEISSLCPSATSTCQGGTNPGVEQYMYQNTVTLGNYCPDWIFSVSECCRNSMITNLQSASSYNLYVESKLDNSDTICNSSPAFSVLPVPYICTNQLSNYNFGAYDADGDSLVYNLINPLGGVGIPIPYNAPYYPDYPITTTTGSVQFDSTTGNLSFTPDANQVCAITVLVQEYRNNILIGSIMRDIQVLILNCGSNSQPYLANNTFYNLSGGIMLDNNSILMCVGTQLTFEMDFSDNDSTDTLTVTSNIPDVIPGAVFDTTGVNPVYGSFSWTPGPSDAGFRTFVVSVIDNNCPVEGEQTYSFDIYVNQGMYAGPDFYLCEPDTVQLQATGSSNFIWTPFIGLSNDSIANPLAFPASTTTYTVTSDCGNSDSVTVFIGTDFSLTIDAPNGICPGATAQLNAMTSPPDTYSYIWYPSSTLSNSTIQNPVATPSFTTTYYVEVLNQSGCKKQKAVTVYVSPVPISINPTSGKQALCSADTTLLDANVTASLCGQYTVGSIPYAPVAGTGSLLFLGDESISSNTPIGFTFNFYCNDYSILAIVSNGFIIFPSALSAGCCSGQALPNPADPNNLVAFAWENLDPSLGGTIEYFTTGTAPYRKMVINFTNIQHWPSGNPVTSQVILYETTNYIEIHTTSMPSNGGLHTMGIENILGTKAVYVTGRNSAVWSAANEGIRFSPLTATTFTTWQDGNGTIIGNTEEISITPDSVATYYVTVTDGMACTVMDSIIVTGAPPLTFITSSSDAECDSSNGNAVVTVSGGVLPYSYLWSDSLQQTSSAATGLPAGVYTVSVTDSSSCTGIATVPVSNTGAPSVNIITVNPVSCYGNGDGSVSSSATGGIPPYTYMWNTSPPQSDSSATGLSAGAYSLSVTDSSGCISTAAVTITQPLPLAVFATTTVATCNQADGSATASVSGGTTAYSYSWNDPQGQSGVTATGLSAGSYDVTVTDNNGCAATASTAVTNPQAPALSFSSVSATFYDWYDGKAIVSASGANPPFTYIWDTNAGNQTSSAATGLHAGAYSVTVTNFNGCYIWDSVTVNQPPATDLMLFAIEELTSGCRLDSDEVVTVYIINLGDTLASGDSVVITYVADSGTVVAETFLFASGFPTADTLAFSFSSTADLSAYGVHLLSAWLNLANDGNTGNDTSAISAENKFVCCIPTYGTICTSGDYIDGVDFAGINNSGTGCNMNPDNYALVTNDTGFALMGVTYPVTLTPPTVYDQGFGIWIDMNHDGDFNDSNEFVFSSAPSITTVSGNISIPFSSYSGLTIMRIRAMYYTTPSDTDYCSYTYYGETEDYFIYIFPPQPYDAGISQLVSPQGCKFDSMEMVTVVITNFGLNALYPGDTIFVSYALDSLPAVNEIIILADTLEFTDTMIYTFTSPVNLSAYSSYQLTVSATINGDGNLMNNSTTGSMVHTPDPVCCTPVFTWQCNLDPAYIDGVQFSGISNLSSGCNGGAGNYNYIPGDTAFVIMGYSYPITLFPSVTWQVGFGVWIDFNHDGDFDENDEFVFSAFPTTAQVSGNISIPATALQGITTMRVVAVAWNTPMPYNSCSTFDYGEAEDYPVYIFQPQPVDVGPTALTAPGDCQLTADETISIEITNFGTNGLSSGDTIIVSYSINGNPPVIEYIILTGNFPSGSTIPYSFSTGADFSQQTTYQLTIIATTSGDGNGLNNYLNTSITNNSACCTPVFTNGCSWGYIDGVEFESINNISSGCNGNPDGYVIVTSDTAFVIQDSTYSITLTPDPVNGAALGVWIDFNSNGDFSDAGEFVFAAPAGFTTVTGNVSIPLSSTPGFTTMRVMGLAFGFIDSSYSCTNQWSGETEDYPVFIVYPSNNIGAISLPAPRSGCDLSSAETVSVEIKNFGYDTITGFPVSYVVDGDTVTEYANDTLYPGDTNLYTFTATTDLSAIGSYTFSIFTSLSGDSETSNDGIIGIIIINKPIISVLPYIQNFDNFNAAPYNYIPSPGTPVIPLADGWENDQTDANIDWVPRSTPTSSSYTGPAHDHTLGWDGDPDTGNYIYVEDNFNGSAVNLISPCFDLSGQPDPALGFWYYNENSKNLNASTLHVDILYNNIWTDDIITPITVAADTNWKYAETSLLSYTGMTMIRFRVDNDNGDPYSDMAIDDFVIYNKISVNLGNDTIICTGQSVVLDATNPGSSYVWSTGVTTQSITVDTSGIFWVEVSDSVTSAVDTIIVTVSDAMTTSVSTVNSDSCICVGIATADIAGGTPPLTYIWNNGQTGSSNSNLCPGAYAVSVTDAAGCTSSGSVTVGGYTPMALTGVVDTATTGLNDGGVDISVTGGTQAFSYYWSNGSSSEDLVNVPGGTYTVTITDADGCSLFASYAVPEKTGMEELLVADCKLRIYPNPNNGSFMFEITPTKYEFVRTYEVRIMNILGEAVFAKVLADSYIRTNSSRNAAGSPLSLRFFVDLDLPQGIYLLRLLTDKGEISRRIVIEK